MINVQFFQLFCMFEKFLNEMFGGKKKAHLSIFQCSAISALWVPVLPQKERRNAKEKKTWWLGRSPNNFKVVSATSNLSELLSPDVQRARRHAEKELQRFPRSQLLAHHVHGRQLPCVFCPQFRASIPANCLATISPVSLGGLPCSKMFLVILTNNPTR